MAAGVAEVERLSPAAYASPDVTVTTVPFFRETDSADVTYLARDDVCTALEVDGRCPERPGEILVNEDDLGADTIGDTVALPFLGTPEIVGVYSTPETSDDFLVPTRFASRPAGPIGRYVPAPYVIANEQMAQLPPRFWSVQLESRLDVPDQVSDAEFDDLVATAERLRSATSEIDGGVVIGNAEVNDLGNVLADVRQQREAARAAVTPAVVALVLIALAMILRLQVAAADLRGLGAGPGGPARRRVAAVVGAGAERTVAPGAPEPATRPGRRVRRHRSAGARLAASRPRGSPCRPAPSSARSSSPRRWRASRPCAVGQGMRETLGARLTGVRRPGRSPRAVLLVELVVVLLAAALPLTRLGADDGRAGPGRPAAAGGRRRSPPG